MRSGPCGDSVPSGMTLRVFWNPAAGVTRPAIPAAPQRLSSRSNRDCGSLRRIAFETPTPPPRPA